MRARVRFVAALLVTLALADAQRASFAEEASTKLTYRVSHSKYGDVGTYSNTIEKSADGASVRTEGSVSVSILGISAYRQSFDRTEHWQGSRLVSFPGITTENGKRTEVNGAADGDHFALATPSGTVTAPGNVRPANPWSEDVLRSETILKPESGKVEKVAASGGELVPIAANGQTVQARHYQIKTLEGLKRYDVWFDGQGIPIRFADVSPSETITFNLSECEGSNNCQLYNREELARR